MRRHAGPLVVALVLVVGPVVLANGYGDAKELIEKAEKALAQGKEDEFLNDMDNALYYQTTVGKKKEPYGYARYIFFRLSKYWHSKGNAKKAKSYIKKALASPEDHDWVDEAYWVSPYDPYIMNNFPALSGLKVKKHPAHKVIPDCIGLRNGPAHHLYGVGNKKVYRLDRKSGDLTTLYERKVDHLYRMDVAGDDNQVVFFYEGDKYIYHLRISPFEVTPLPRPTGVDSLHIDEQNDRVVVYNRGSYKYKVAATQISKPHGKTTLASGDGRVFMTHPQHMLYATWSYAEGKNFHPYYSPRYEHVMSRRFKDPDPKRIFTFPIIDFRNKVDRIHSRSGDIEALYLRDFARGKELIVVQDWNSGDVFTHELTEKLEIDPCGSYCPLAATFSFNEDHIVMFDIQEKQVRVLRFDFASPRLTELGVIPLSKGGKLKGKFDAREIHRIGTLKDNATVWIHWGDRIVFVDAQGQVKFGNLKALSKAKKPEWAGPTLYVTDPDQFYVGIEKGAGRYFMMAPLDKLLKP